MQPQSQMSYIIIRVHFCVSGGCSNPVLSTFDFIKTLLLICSVPQEYWLGSRDVFFLIVPRTTETKVKIWEELWQVVGHGLSYFLCSLTDSVAFARDSWEMQRVARMSGLEMVFLTATIVISDPEVSTECWELYQYCSHGFNWWVCLALTLRHFIMGRGVFPCHFNYFLVSEKISKPIKFCPEDLCSALLDLKAVSVHKHKLLHYAFILRDLEAWISHFTWHNADNSTWSRTLGHVWRSSHFLSLGLPFVDKMVM